MTREEAIQELKKELIDTKRLAIDCEIKPLIPMVEALEMAIDALQRIDGLEKELSELKIRESWRMFPEEMGK